MQTAHLHISVDFVTKNIHKFIAFLLKTVFLLVDYLQRCKQQINVVNKLNSPNRRKSNDTKQSKHNKT